MSDNDELHVTHSSDKTPGTAYDTDKAEGHERDCGCLLPRWWDMLVAWLFRRSANRDRS